MGNDFLYFKARHVGPCYDLNSYRYREARLFREGSGLFFREYCGKTGVAFVRSAVAGWLQKFLIAIPGETGSRQFREVKLEMLREM